MIEDLKYDDGFIAFLWDNLLHRDRMRVLKDYPKTVWIFGAGASHHYAMNHRGIHIPLADGFFGAFHSLPTSEGFQAHVGPLINYLYRSRGIKPTEVTTWKENIEEFMTSIEREIDDIISSRNAGVTLSEDESIKAVATATA